MAKYLIGNIKGPKGDQGPAGADGRDGAIQYTAGNGISIDGNVISATGSGGSDFSGDYNDLTNKPDLSVYATTTALGTGLARKQDTLTAGENITIENNVISATGGSSGSGYSDTDTANYIKNTFGMSYTRTESETVTYNFTAGIGDVTVQTTIPNPDPQNAPHYFDMDPLTINVENGEPIVIAGQRWEAFNGGASPDGWGAQMRPTKDEFGVTITFNGTAGNPYVDITKVKVEGVSNATGVSGGVVTGGVTETVTKLQDKFIPDTYATKDYVDKHSQSWTETDTLSVISNHFGMGTYDMNNQVDIFSTTTNATSTSIDAPSIPNYWDAIYIDVLSATDGSYVAGYCLAYNGQSNEITWSGENGWSASVPYDESMGTIGSPLVVNFGGPCDGTTTYQIRAYQYQTTQEIQKLNTQFIPIDYTTIIVDENGQLKAVGDGSGGGGIQSESDPIFQASAAAGITSTDISNWNGKSTLPSYSTGDAGKVLAVNSTEDGVEWTTPSGGGATYTAGTGINITNGVISSTVTDTNTTYTAGNGIDIDANNEISLANDIILVEDDGSSTVPKIELVPSGLSVYTEDKDTEEWTEDSWVSSSGIGVENVMNSTTASMVSNEIKFSHDENGETLEVSLKPNSTYTRLQLNGSDDIAHDIAFVSDIPADELPTIASGDAGKVLTVNSGETGVEWTTPSGGGATYSDANIILDMLLKNNTPFSYVANVSTKEEAISLLRRGYWIAPSDNSIVISPSDFEIDDKKTNPRAYILNNGKYIQST